MEGCCDGGTAGATRSGGAGRAARGAGWLASGAVLALMPKCPACVAGYVLLLTGVGISLSAAAAIRWGLLGLATGGLGLLALSAARRALRSATSGRRST